MRNKFTHWETELICRCQNWIRFEYMDLWFSSGIGIDGKSGGNGDSFSNQDRLQLMIRAIRLQQRRRQEMCQMESCVWSVWWGEGDLHSFHVGTWYAAKAVPSPLSGNPHPNVLSVGRKYVTHCGYMILEANSLCFLNWNAVLEDHACIGRESPNSSRWPDIVDCTLFKWLEF